ncbi:MAG: hypothetical protein KJO10_06570 [Gammaproteobacteria bacterium]|nr:hypothetical protein [Gammaproteobacteria bacterium]
MNDVGGQCIPNGHRVPDTIIFGAPARLLARLEEDRAALIAEILESLEASP